MRITRLAVADWRNLPRAELSTDARFVVLHGDNAQGKTNLLEAVWMLAALRSFREAQPRRLIREGAGAARVEARLEGVHGHRRLLLKQGPQRRWLAADEAPVRSLATWFELLRAVLFIPDHIALVRGTPQLRRDYLDRAIFTLDPSYLGLAADYRRAVGQKAALLRRGGVGAAELQPWNQRLVELGARIALRRHAFLERLRPAVIEAARRIGGPRELQALELGLRSLGGEAQGPGEVTLRLSQALERFGGEEQRRGRVLVGPHRDDLLLRLEGRLAADFASQGQARTLVLSLKLAELSLARARGLRPLFLIDDLSSELDRGRMQRLLELLMELDNQVWITTTDPGWLTALPAGESRFWRVSEGQVFLEKGPSTG